MLRIASTLVLAILLALALLLALAGGLVALLSARLRSARTIAAALDASLRSAQAREAILVDEARARNEVLENVPVGVAFLDTRGNVTYVNPQLASLLGMPNEPPRGLEVFGLDWVRDQPELIVRLRDLLHWERFQGLQFTHRPARGPERALSATGVPVFEVPDEGDPLHKGAILILQDVSAQRRAEAAIAVQVQAIALKNRELEQARASAESAARTKAEFLANMSHEIRTPLNAVIGMTTLLQETRLDTRQKEFAGTIRTSGEALLTLINDILDFSKIESGKLEIERASLDVRACVESSLDIVAARGGASASLRLSYEMDEDVPARVLGDLARTRQVLINLVGNAMKFTKEGEVAIRVSVASRGDDQELRFAVRDTGIGISREGLSRLFESFSQVDSSITRRYGGTGLGLAISKRLARLMDGDITVTSAEGVGSTFTLSIRVGRAPADPPAPSHIEGRRILVIADPSAASIARALRAEVVHATRPEAREILARFRPEVVLADDGALDDGLASSCEERAIPLVAIGSAGAKTGLTRPLAQGRVRDALSAALGLASASPETPAPSERALEGMHILLAEDNPVNQRLMVLSLERTGCLLDVVSNGREAVDAAGAKRYDAILMDMQMPVMDGLDATRTIRARQGAHAPRIVALTANASTEDRAACLEAGMDDHISKPVNVARLIALLTGAGSATRTVVPVIEEPALDEAVLRELEANLAGEEAALAELFASFLTDTDALLVRMDKAVDSQDAGELRLASHSLKGNAGAFGAMRVSRLAARIEAQAKAAVWGGAREHVDELIVEWSATRALLDQRGRAPARLAPGA